jgi:ADP-heptose:LPS heptosyltransferase
MPTFQRLIPAGRQLTAEEFHLNEQLVRGITESGKLDMYIRRIKGLGDVLLASLIVRALSKKLPSRYYNVHLITNPCFRELIKKAKIIDSVLDDTEVSGSCVVDLQDKIDYLPECAQGHRLDLMAKIVGLSVKDIQTDFRVNVSGVWRNWGRAKLKELRKGGLKIIALAPWATAPIRSWPKWLEFLFFLLQSESYAVVLLHAEPVKALEHHNLLNLTGRTGAMNLFSILSECDAAVVVDSGILHACGFIGTPFVGLFGSIDPEFRVKYYSNKRILFLRDSCKICPCWDWQRGACIGTNYYMSCMENITALMAYRALKKLLVNNVEVDNEAAVEMRPVWGSPGGESGQVHKASPELAPRSCAGAPAFVSALD